MVYAFILLLQLVILYFLSKRVKQHFQNLLIRLTRNKKISVWIFAIFFLPGTIIHELSHLVTALVLFIPVGKIKLIPEVEENKVALGSVSFTKVDIFRSTIVGLAPFVIGILTIFALLSYVTQNNLLTNYLWLIVTAYIIFQVGNSMFLSKSDLSSAFKLLLVFLIVYIILYYFGVKISFDANSLFSDAAIKLIKKANIFLLVPIVIDLVALLLVRPVKILGFTK
jgi:hypothetical protein